MIIFVTFKKTNIPLFKIPYPALQTLLRFSALHKLSHNTLRSLAQLDDLHTCILNLASTVAAYNC